MNPTASDLSVASFFQTNNYLSIVYYVKVTWPYLVVAFLIGSIPFGLILGRVFFQSDIRSSGSGNIGAANAARTYGRGAGIAVFVLDALKGVVAVVACKAVVFSLLTNHANVPFFATPMLPTPPFQYADTPISVSLALGPLAALAAVLGHCYSPWLGFKGGKGVATFFGTLCGLGLGQATVPYSLIVFAIVWILIALRTGYASLASMLATAAVAVLVCARNYRQGDGDVAIAFVLIVLAVVVARHGANIARLRNGTEPKLELTKSEGPSDSGGKRVGSI